MLLSVWRPITCSPGFGVLADALAHHVSPEAGALLHTGPFSLGEADALIALLAGAGFRDVQVQEAMQMVRFPSPQEFVRRYVAGTTLASFVAQADDNARAALLDEVNQGLQAYTSADGVAFPIETNLARARK